MPSGRSLPKTSRTTRITRCCSRECAAYLGVSEAQLLLTNGLDEGLLALTVSAFRAMQGSHGLPEAIVPTPAFEMYSVFVKAAGGRVISVSPNPDFAFQLKGVCEAISDRTRVIFLTSPNNPTGQIIPRDAIREIARCAPPEVDHRDRRGVLRFLRRDVSCRARQRMRMSSSGGRSRRRTAWPGCARDASSAIPAGSKPVRNAVPPYSLSVFAVAGWRAALRDREHLDWYRAQVSESRELLYAACDRLGLPYWKSAGNFVLINVETIGRARRYRRRPSPSAAFWCAIARAIRGAPAASASRRASFVTQRPPWKCWRVCAPCRNRQENTRDADSRPTGDRGQGPLRHSNRHPLSRSHARADDAPRRVRSRGARHR